MQFHKSSSFCLISYLPNNINVVASWQIMSNNDKGPLICERSTSNSSVYLCRPYQSGDKYWQAVASSISAKYSSREIRTILYLRLNRTKCCLFSSFLSLWKLAFTSCFCYSTDFLQSMDSHFVILHLFHFCILDILNMIIDNW